MSQNSNDETDKKDLLGKTSVLLGIMATALGIFISFRTHVISEQTQNILGTINKLEVINKNLDNKLKSFEIDIKSREIAKSKPKIVKEFLVLNAKAFTNRIDEAKNVGIIWPDKQIEDDIMSYANSWKTWDRLMTRSSQKLFLRQVVCLRIINLGGSPARDVSVIIRKKSFNNSQGDNLDQPYYELDAGNWTEKNILIQELMGMNFQDQVKTEILIPLAHVSKDDRYFKYFGSMAIPIKITWYDNQDATRTPDSLSINVSEESVLKSDLDSKLGQSKR